MNLHSIVCDLAPVAFYVLRTLHLPVTACFISCTSSNATVNLLRRNKNWPLSVVSTTTVRLAKILAFEAIQIGYGRKGK